jgi:hypothetical protein
MDADCINAESKSSSECPHCGASDNFFTKEKSPHIGLYCRSCDRWIRWIPRREAANFSAKPAKSPRVLGLAPRVENESKKPANCGHCAEISRLLDHLVKIERHLEIVTRARWGQAGDESQSHESRLQTFQKPRAGPFSSGDTRRPLQRKTE